MAHLIDLLPEGRRWDSIAWYRAPVAGACMAAMGQTLEEFIDVMYAL